MRYLTASLGLLVVSLSQVAGAQTCELVADINTDPIQLSSWPGGIEREAPVEMGGQLYFRAWNKGTGMELFRTDGTTSGTVMVADILPGPNSSNPLELTPHAGRLYFTAEDPVAGRELWSSDGTAAGTLRVKDIGPGADDGQIGELTSAGSRLFFVADDGATGLEVWSTDGTSAGTQLVADVVAGPGSPEPAELVFDAAGSRVFLSVTLPGIGRELAFIDTQALTPGLVADIAPGAASSNPEGLVMLGNKLVFRAVDASLGSELWISDGGAAGTALIKDIQAGPESSTPTLEVTAVLGSELFFAAWTESQGTELWKTDGTTAGTLLVADVKPGTGSGEPTELVSMGGEIYFMANEYPGVGRELFATSAAPGSLRLVKDIAPGGSSYPRFLTVDGNRIFFTAMVTPGAMNPWVTDGTTAGTQQLMFSTPTTPGYIPPAGLAALPGGGIVFSTNTSGGVELMLSDGTLAGTGLLADVEPAFATNHSKPLFLRAVYGQELYFSATTPGAGRELWHWSSAGGVSQVIDLAPGPASSLPGAVTPAWLGDHSLIFFQAEDGTLGRELWATDGTAAGTFLVKDIQPGAKGSIPKDLLGALSQLFFVAKEPALGSSLWVTDGTTSGTKLLSPPGIGANGGAPKNLVELGDQVLFSRKDTSDDRELWATDGRLAGTVRLLDLNPQKSSNPQQLTRAGEHVVFTARLGISVGQNSVWVTDGTTAGTLQVMPTGPPPSLLGVSGFAVLNDKVYFLAWANPGIDIWAIDPNVASMSLVANASPFNSGLDFKLTASSDRLFFRTVMSNPAGDDLGFELVVSDGTQAGTHLVVDLAPGSKSSYPADITPVSGGVYFAPNALEYFDLADPPAEIHFTDGTALGTYVVCPTPPGDYAHTPTLPLATRPIRLTLAGGSLFWRANDINGAGIELFRMPQPGGHTIVLEPSGSGQRIDSNDPVLGTTLTVTGTLASPTDLSLLVMSAPVAAPHATLVAFGSAAWVDPASLSVLTMTTSPSWTYTTTLPATPALAGAQFTLQSWTLPSPALLPAETSNGLTIVLGS